MMDRSALGVFFEVLSCNLAMSNNEVRRVFHGRGRCYSGLEQITADWFGQGVLQITVFKEQDTAFYEELTRGVRALCCHEIWTNLGGKTVLLQHRERERTQTQVLIGELPSQLNVVENGLSYTLDLGKRQNNGLFLDMRLGRQWVQAHAREKRVLNLFAYTCGFSVAAIAGGAQSVVNLDMAKSSLSRGRENHQLNHHDMTKVTFLAHELFKSWGKVKKHGPYDLIIIDPPSFQKGSFVLTKDYDRILRRLPELIIEGGDVLACVNSPDISPHFLIEKMSSLPTQFTFISRLDNPPEFNDIDSDKALKVMHFRHQNECSSSTTGIFQRENHE